MLESFIVKEEVTSPGGTAKANESLQLGRKKEGEKTTGRSEESKQEKRLR